MTKNITCETIGCDIGDKTSEICVLRTDGTKVEAKVPTTQKGMTKFFSGREAAHVVTSWLRQQGAILRASTSGRASGLLFFG
jgi:hypothetical protein